MQEDKLAGKLALAADNTNGNSILVFKLRPKNACFPHCEFIRRLRAVHPCLLSVTDEWWTWVFSRAFSESLHFSCLVPTVGNFRARMRQRKRDRWLFHAGYPVLSWVARAFSDPLTPLDSWPVHSLGLRLQYFLIGPNLSVSSQALYRPLFFLITFDFSLSLFLAWSSVFSILALFARFNRFNALHIGKCAKVLRIIQRLL